MPLWLESELRFCKALTSAPMIISRGHEEKGRPWIRERASCLLVRMLRSTSPTCSSVATMLKKMGKKASCTHANSLSHLICETVRLRDW